MRSLSLTSCFVAALLVGISTMTMGANCDNPSGDGDGDGDGDDDRTLSERYADAYIEYYEKCFTSSETYSFYAEIEGEEFQSGIDYETLRDQLDEILSFYTDDPSVSVDEALFEACVSGFEAEAAKDDCDDIDTEALNNAACNDFLEGVLGEGDACDYALQCQSGQCTIPDDAECGVCAEGDGGLGGEGESCDSRGCEDSLACNYDYESEAYFCVAYAQEGEDCESAPCDEGLECEYVGDGTDVCVVPAELGESCEEIDCVDDLVCHDLDNVCVMPATAGESCEDVYCSNDEDGPTLFCNYDLEMPVCEVVIEGDRVGDNCTPRNGSCGYYLSTGLVCVAEEGEALGECAEVQIAEVGEACDNGTGAGSEIVCRKMFSETECDYDYVENTGVCVQRGGPGDSCDEISCISDVASCDYDLEDPVCVAHLAVGDACVSGQGADCDPDAYCNDDDVCEAYNSGDTGLPELMCVESD